jgi:hypothetical protein
MSDNFILYVLSVDRDVHNCFLLCNSVNKIRCRGGGFSVPSVILIRCFPFGFNKRKFPTRNHRPPVRVSILSDRSYDPVRTHDIQFRQEVNSMALINRTVYWESLRRF